MRSALFAFSKVVYTVNKDKQYRVFKEEVRSLASEVAAKHLAKSSSAAVNRVPGAGEGKVDLHYCSVAQESGHCFSGKKGRRASATETHLASLSF